nr:ATP-binding protein [Phytoactinopolyspora mesophila]
MIERHLLAQLREVGEYARIVLVNGPRQAGKTTLLEQLHAELGGWLRSMDADVERASARADPEGYVMSAPRPTFLDEVQRVGDPLILAIKIVTDRDRRPGQFYLSGSTRFLTVPTISESLAGRIAVLDLWPLSVAERAGVGPQFIERLLDGPQALLAADTAPVTRHEYLQVACTGGFPEVVRRPVGRPRSRWFADYLRTVTQRDVRELKQIEQVERLPRFMRYLAAVTAQELNVAEAARVMGVDAGTIRSDLALFETVYLVHRLPAWSQNLTAKIKKRPKIHVIDSGFAAWLRGQSADSLARPTSEGAGPILETFVVNELMKLRAAADLEVDLYHFRDRDGREIDCILQTPDGRAVGVEVKAATTVNAHDFRHLSLARDRLGNQFVAGVVFYTGSRSLPFGDRLMALPINHLWGGKPVSAL